MQIFSISSYSLNKCPKPSFKAAYPVYYWVKDNGGYAPAVTKKLSKTLQSKLVRYMNRSIGGCKNQKTIKSLEEIFAKVQKALTLDKDYFENPVTRSFYNHKGGWQGEKFEPISYLITGEDVLRFEELYGKPIGRANRDVPKIYGMKTAEHNSVSNNYRIGGLYYAKTNSKHFIDENGKTCGLHVKYKAIRNKKGFIKGYKFEDMKFLPETGEKNPFVKLSKKNK